MIKFNKILILFVLLSVNAFALPQYSMLSGNKCINCHVNPAGSGIRNDLGWYARNDVGLINPGDIGLGGFFKNVASTNQAFNKLLLFGFDFRYETAMIGPPDKPTRKYFGMAATPYLSLKPFNWLNLGGSYNIFYDVYNKTRYPGQKAWTAYMIVQPDITMPSLKAGYFSPPIGIHFDDHTVLVDQVPGGGQPQLIPPDFSEYGAEINYEGLKWLSLTAGVFQAKSMAENTVRDSTGNVVPLTNKDKISFAVNGSLWQRFFENKLNLQLGGSYYINDDFNISSVYFNAGLTDELSLITELLMTNKKDIRKSRNFVVGLMYQLHDGLLIEARLEKAFTDDLINKLNWTTNQYLIGLHIFPLPYIELRPEYRIYDREWAEGYMAQYAVQIHLYY
ncbi:MAG: hypothetical protein HZB41_11240 [Ignavibacteriae bacterium]|nr:hypothetical protein [Ignavibacteriota bacterium]